MHVRMYLGGIPSICNAANVHAHPIRGDGFLVLNIFPNGSIGGDISVVRHDAPHDLKEMNSRQIAHPSRPTKESIAVPPCKKQPSQGNTNDGPSTPSHGVH
jgi:hypothetical protein